MQTFQALLKHILLQSISANVNSVVIFVLQVENAGVHLLGTILTLYVILEYILY